MRKRIVRILTCFLSIALLAQTPVSATYADYYDNGFYKTKAGYINRLGEVIDGVTSRGIDVSSFQGNIDWDEVAEDDVSFVFIRCGNSRKGMDTKFCENATGAKKAGIPFGLYYRTFAPNEEIAVMEAEYTVLCAKKYGATLPLVIDIEGSELAALGSVQLQKNVAAFCETVKDAGYEPLIYASKSFVNSYLSDSPYPKWIAQYGDYLTYEGKAEYWQCSSHGYVKGIEGRVDIDLKFSLH